MFGPVFRIVLQLKQLSHSSVNIVPLNYNSLQVYLYLKMRVYHVAYVAFCVPMGGVDGKLSTASSFLLFRIFPYSRCDFVSVSGNESQNSSHVSSSINVHVPSSIWSNTRRLGVSSKSKPGNEVKLESKLFWECVLVVLMDDMEKSTAPRSLFLDRMLILITACRSAWRCNLRRCCVRLEELW